MTMDAGEVSVTLADVPRCPRCSRPGLLLARYPHSWSNGEGREVQGLRESLLCAGCDQADPAAAELLSLFLVDDHLRAENLMTFHELATTWVAAAGKRSVDEAQLAEEEASWNRGEL